MNYKKEFEEIVIRFKEYKEEHNKIVDSKISKISKMLASVFNNGSNENRACVCIAPSCYALDCGIFWKQLLNSIDFPIDINELRNEIRNLSERGRE